MRQFFSHLFCQSMNERTVHTNKYAGRTAFSLNQFNQFTAIFSDTIISSFFYRESIWCGIVAVAGNVAYNADAYM